MSENPGRASWWRRLRDRWREANARAARMEQQLDGTIAEGHSHAAQSKLRHGVNPGP